MSGAITLLFPKNPFLINPVVFPPLGILYLSSYLKSWGIDVKCVDMNWWHDDQVYTCLDLIDTELVGISVTTPQRIEAYKYAKYLSDNGHTVIAGGPHATHMPEECLDNGFHFVVKGDGEIALLTLIISSRGEALPSVFECTIPKGVRIDHFPFPDREALPIGIYDYEIDGLPATPIMTSRGCPFNCTFCANIKTEMRMQSAERTIAEILHLHAMYGFEAFMIYDDVFTINRTRTEQIANYFDRSGLVFRCFSRANLLGATTCNHLKKMGVVEVGIGIESGSDKILSRNMKGTSTRVNLDAIKVLKSVGIRSKAFIIVGLPGETEQTVQETVDWLHLAKPNDVDFTVFQPLPGSPIFENPSKFEIDFNYDSQPMWYKGKPGEYQSSVSTKELSSDRIVELRDLLEREFKRPELLK